MLRLMRDLFLYMVLYLLVYAAVFMEAGAPETKSAQRIRMRRAEKEECRRTVKPQ